MPRPERVLEPGAGPVQWLAAQLRELRRMAGSPGYRELASRAGYSVAALANAAGGRQLPSLPVTLAFVRACGGDPVVWEERWREVAAEWAQLQAKAVGVRTGVDMAQPPYRGLAGYGVDDADWFFGRERLIRQLVQMLDRQRFVAVFGASGSGKSSLLRAGLVPAMRCDGCRPEKESAASCPGYLPVLMTPGAEPVAALRRALQRARRGHAVLLVIDQFEELFTLCRDAGVRTRFVADLAGLVEDGATSLRVVIGVRADFYTRCSELPALAGLLAGANVPVGPLDEEELRQVIAEPARRAGLSVERALVTKILADASGQPGALPLVSHALLETWRHRRGEMLTLAGYEAAGAMAGAIARTAEMMYQRFDSSRQATARQVLTRLVTLGEGVADTRRRVARSELDFAGVDTVLHELAAARLIVLAHGTTDSVDMAGTANTAGTVDIAHEALIAAWPRLHDWLHTDRQSARLHRQLTEDSHIWDALGRDHGALYRGARLAAWDGRAEEGLNPLELTFLDAGRNRAAHESAQRRRRIKLALVGLATAVVVMSLLAGLALVQANRANDQRELALSRQLVADARSQLQVDQELALLLAREAYDIKPTLEAQTVLRQATVDSRIRAVLPAERGRVFGVAYSADGRRLAGSGENGDIWIWDRAGPDRWQALPRVLSGHTGAVLSPQFSPDGRWLAACGTDGTVIVWDLTTGAAATVLSGHGGEVTNVAFSADGQRLAGAGQDGTVRVWDRTDRSTLQVLRLDAPAQAVDFSRDGRWLAAGDDSGHIRIWDATAFGQPRVLTGHEGSVEDISFSPGGDRLASASADTTVRVWTTGPAEPPVVLRGNDGVVETVAFSPDGRRVAGAHSGSDTIWVWNANSVQDPLLLRGHREPVWSVAFSPDGKRLASGSGDGTVRIWDPAYHGDPRVLNGDGTPVTGVDASGDGQRIVSGGADGTIRVWTTGGPGRTGDIGDPLVLHGHTGEVLQVVFSSDGSKIASAGRDRTVRIWDAVTGQSITVLRGHTGAAISVAFSPDGKKVASAGSKGDATVRIWDATGQGPPVVLAGHEDWARYVAFSPDGRTVASTDNGGTVRISNSNGQGTPIILRGHPVGLVWCADFSPDGRHVASGGQDGSLRIWNTDGSGEPTILRGQQGSVWSVDYSPDGRQLVSVGDIGGGLRIWHAGSGTEMAAYRGHGASVEQARFTPDGYHLVTAHDDGTVRIWHCDACRPIEHIRALADIRVTRTLTPQERDTYLASSTL